jgi:hypothetical protein
LDGKEIETVKEIKYSYLGMMLDSGGKWEKEKKRY